MKLLFVCVFVALVAFAAADDQVPATQLQGDCGGCGGANGGAKMDVKDAIEPVNDWIRDFKRRTGAGASNMWGTAQETVKPLLRQLKRNQKKALEKIKDSNKKIVEHVRDEASEHLFNLFKSQKHADDAKDEAVKKEDKAKALEEKAADINERKVQAEKTAAKAEKMEAKAQLANSNVTANAVANGVKFF